MKIFIAIALLFLSAGSLFSQNHYYTQMNYAGDTLFPFSIPLLDIDSTKVLNSKNLMAIPKKEKQKRPTVIAFWLTTCRPCHQELATYTAAYPEWKKQANFNMYAISIDFPHNFRKVAPMVREKKFPFEVYWDRDQLYRTVMPGGLNGLPQVFIFDKNGKLAYKHKGFRPGDELTLFEQIKSMQ